MLTFANDAMPVCPPRADAGRAAPDHDAVPTLMTTSDVCHIVGHLELDVARRHHVEMTAVFAELAHDAGRDWPWTHDHPTIAVLRAFARLSVLAPDAVSERAAAFCRRLEADTAVAR